MNRLVTIIVGLLLLVACGKEGIEGKWHGNLSVTIGGELSLTLEESDEKVHGHARYLDRAGTFGSDVSGTVKGDAFELTFPDLEGSAHYEGNVEGDEMNGTWTRRTYPESLTMHRQHD